MAKIVCSIALFDATQRIVLYEDNKIIDSTVSNLNLLPEMIVNFSYKHDVSDIILSGATEEFTNEIKNKIYVTEHIKFGKNKISVEVI